MLAAVTSVAYVAAFLGLVYVAWMGMVALLSFRRKMNILKKIPHSQEYHWLLGHLYYFPGPTEEGLAFFREKGAELPRMGLVFYGRLNGVVGVTHPETVKVILKTTGPGEKGIERMLCKTVELPRMSLVFFGPTHYAVNVRHPDTIKVILKSSEPKPRWIGGYKCARPWLGDGLLISKGDKWARNRRLLTPAFHFDILKPYVPIKNKAVELLMEKWDKVAEQGEYLEVFSDVSLCTLDIILRCAFSYDNDCQIQGEQHPYVKRVNELGRGLVDRMLKPWLYPDWIFFLTSAGQKFKANCDFVHKYSHEVINKRRQAIAEAGGKLDHNSRYLDFLDILLTAKDEEGIGLTDQEIRDEVDTFMFEGHDTTASGISWTLHELARHPEHLHKCQQEVDSILEGRSDDALQWEDLSKLKYLTMCIKEAMRLRTPVPLIEREVTCDTKVDGYTIPAGTVIDINLYNLHHNPTVWDNSLEYQPSRFLPENIEKMDPYAFIPFSAGPRNCIGQHFAMDEQKIVIARIIRRFNLEMDPSRPARQFMALVMRTEFGMWMKVTPRSK